MANGTLFGIYIAPEKGARMQKMNEVQAITGQGLAGDRYALGAGSFNTGRPGRRQVTLVNRIFILDSSFDYADTRRNLVVDGIELMDQIGHEFCIDDVVLRGVKYCDPCVRPGKLAGISASFQTQFADRGGLIAEIIRGGLVRIGSVVTPRKKDY